MMNARLTYRSAQNGAALIVSMVMLLVITVIGITVMGGSRLEWLMASNSHFQTTAYLNAESALAAGLATLPTNASPLASPLPPPLLADATNIANWNNASLGITTAAGSGEFIVEYLGCSTYILFGPNNTGRDMLPCDQNLRLNVHAYRVWARGWDSKGASRILSAIHTIVFNRTGGVYSDAILNGVANDRFGSYNSNRVEVR